MRSEALLNNDASINNETDICIECLKTLGFNQFEKDSTFKALPSKPNQLASQFDIDGEDKPSSCKSWVNQSKRILAKNSHGNSHNQPNLTVIEVAQHLQHRNKGITQIPSAQCLTLATTNSLTSTGVTVMKANRKEKKPWAPTGETHENPCIRSSDLTP